MDLYSGKLQSPVHVNTYSCAIRRGNNIGYDTHACTSVVYRVYIHVLHVHVYRDYAHPNFDSKL